jgi:arylsulfatase A-like enzyme
VVADKAIAELRRLKDKPFFLAVGFVKPHLPFNAPKRYWDLYERDAIPLAPNPFVPRGAPPMAINNLRELRGYTDFTGALHPTLGPLSEADARLLRHGYLASVSYVDAQIGRLLDQLEALDLADDTIVVLWGDHGWKLGEHASWGKMTNYEDDTRVPLIVRAPGRAGNGRSSDALVELVDLFPTLSELCGVPVPDDLEGTSLAPLLSDPDRSWKRAAFSQYLRTGIWIGPEGAEHNGHAVRTDRWRYVEWTRTGTGELAGVELYDHASDPQENTNLADHPEHADTLAELRELLHAGWQAALPGEDRDG